MPSQLVAYSGFSATNYISEVYSADLDFGVGEFLVGAHVNVPTVLPLSTLGVIDVEKAANPDFTSDISGWTNPAELTWSAGRAVAVSAASSIFYQVLAAGGYQVTVNVATVTSGSLRIGSGGGGLTENIGPTITSPGAYSFKFYTGHGAVGISTASFVGEVESLSVKPLELFALADRSAATGPSIKLGMDAAGKLTAAAFDGTTTRTVTTTAAYNTGAWLKAEAAYKAGKLGIIVNGVEVASVTGAPLLSMNSRWNLLDYTEEFENTYWTKFGLLPLTAGNTASPFGRLTADKIVEDTSTGNHTVRPSAATAVLAGVYEGSVYLKAAERGYGAVQITDSASKRYGVVVDLATGTVTASSLSASPTSTSVLVTDAGNGWRRVQLRMDFAAGSAYLFTSISNVAIPAFSLAMPSYAGDGMSGIYVCGADLRPVDRAALPYQRVNTATDFDYAATLTIGNSRTLDAPWPGSITMLKLGATVPTPEQSLWMYEQEKQMFRADAQICLPSSTAVLDLDYDESRDRWTAIQAGNESSFTGLIRTSTAAVSAGSFTKISTKNGVKLQARSTTSPGVDVVVPAYGLREELVRRGEAAAKASKTLTVFDMDSISFTAAMTTGSAAVTASTVVGVPYLGMGITGTGVPANTTIIGINGTTYTLSAACTATASNAVAQNTFTLPAGWTATEVLAAGASKREGATKDFVRQYDGFRETISFAVSPGAASWVQITAKKE